MHHYIFTLYALDIESCGLSERFGGPEVLAAIEGHILDSARITGTYVINPPAGLRLRVGTYNVPTLRSLIPH